ncbi:hypothetical protein CFP56_025693 [Quercus suber]|uniref:Uncharacterized protein n=1 Tax=Quercus suber TaxID=58331 RepID=A0AAW0K2K4_QUESU
MEGNDGLLFQTIQHLTAFEELVLFNYNWDGIGMAMPKEASKSKILRSSKIGLSSSGTSTCHLSTKSQDFKLSKFEDFAEVDLQHHLFNHLRFGIAPI